MKLHRASRGAILRTTGVLIFESFRNELLLSLDTFRSSVLSMHLRVSLFLRMCVTACTHLINKPAERVE
jgi:hypothetical protein